MELKYKKWEDITVNVFEELTTAIANAEETGIEDVDILNKHISILSVLCEEDEEVIANLNPSEFYKLVKQTDFLNEQPKKDIINKLTLNGKEYEIFLSVGEMTMSQYIDFQTLYKDSKKNFKQLLAIFILPKGKKYCDGYDIQEVINDIGKYLPITDANNILFFFVLAFQSLTKATLKSLVRQLKKMKKNEKNREKINQIETAITQIQQAANLVENGDGFSM